MSDTVKLIIEIPTGGAFERDIYTPICAEGFIRDEYNEKVAEAIKNGIPLDSNDSDYAEAQAYFAGMSYGWKQGQKDFAEKLKAEIDRLPLVQLTGYLDKDDAMQILDHIGKAESEEI